MTEVRYDVTNVRPRELVRAHDWRDGGAGDAEAPPGSFGARVEARRVDLVALVKHGIPPRQYHAQSEGMFVRGKRHLIAAPAKTGKSIVCLAHWVRLALAGERVVVLDRENGADVYAERLDAIMAAWQLTDAQRALVSTNLNYYEYPTLKRDDAVELVRHFEDELAADLLVFDSQRMFLTDYGLSERDTDDYSMFMAYAVDPVHRAGITTVILDNTGHGDSKRARGSSSKGDLNEVLFHLKVAQPFDRTTRGIAELTVDYSRFGDRGSWRMAIGAGVFGDWESSTDRAVKIVAAKPELQATVYAVLRAAGEPVGWKKLLAAVRDRGAQVGKDGDVRQALKQWADDPAEPLTHIPRRGYACDA